MARVRLIILLMGAVVLGVSANAVRANEANEQMALGDLRTFEVHQFEKHDFSSARERVLPEMVEYARTAIQNDERLLYRSPGEGVVHFYCDSPQCGRIRVEVTQGQDGPVVWKTTKQFRPAVALVEPDSRKFAKAVVQELATDYEAAVKEVPATIPIQD